MLTNSSWSNLLQGVAQATSQLLTTADYGLGINLALATLGQVTNVDRVYIAQIHPHPETGEPATSLRYEWSRDTVEPQIANPRVQNVPFSAFGMERWYDEIQHGQPLSLLVRDYPVDSGERQRFEPQGILSIIVVPIPVNGEFWGVVGFDDCQSERRWSKDEEAVLMTMAATLGGAIAHRQTEAALRQSQSRVEQIAANVPGMIFQFLQRKDRSRSILYASSGCIELYELPLAVIQSNSELLTDLIHPDDRETYEQSVAASIATSSPWNWEGRIITPSSKLKWVQGRSRPQQQPNGDILWDGFMVDITDRKQAEVALQQSEARNRAFVNAIPDLMFRLQRDGTYLDVKAENVSDLLIDPTQAIGQTVYDVLPPDVAQERMYYVEQALKTGEVQSFEYQLSFNGKERDYEARIVVSGEDEVLTIVRDITERRQAECSLRESEERFRNLVEKSLAGIYVIQDGKFPYVNPKFAEIFGYTLEEFLSSRDLSNLPIPEDADLVAENVRKRLEGEVETIHYTFRGQKKDGTLITLEVLGNKTEFKGKPAMIGTLLDISDRQRAEAQLREKEAQYRSIFESTSDGLIINDPDTGLIVEANPACCQMHGYTYDEFIGLNPKAFVHPNSYHLYEEYMVKLKAGESFICRADDVRKDGTIFQVEVLGTRFMYRGKPHFLAVVRDITEQLQAEVVRTRLIASLQEKEEQYRSIFEATSDALLINRLDGTLIEANPAAYKMHGYSYEEFIHLDPTQYIHPNFHLKLKDFFETIKVGGEYRIQSINIRKDGSTFPVDVFGIGFTYKGELHSLAIIRDITERIKAEAELRLGAQRDRLRAEIASRIRQSLNIEQILKTTVTEVRQFLKADRVFIIQINESQNPMFAESVATGWGSIRGLFFEDLEDNDTLRRLIPMFIAGGVIVINDASTAEISPLRAEYFAKYGVKASLAVPIEVSGSVSGRLAAHQCSTSRQWQQWEIDLLEQLATQVAIALQQAQLYQEVQDLNTNLEQIVEQRTQELQQKYAELQELHQLKDVFLHAVSHDLRTPVMGWLLVLNNLLNQQPVLNRQVASSNEQPTISVSHSILERMIQSSDRQLRLIDSLLDVHQSEVQGMVLQREPLQLKTLIQNLVEDLAALLEKNQATLTNHVTTDLPVILADSTQLQRVFENLLSNAMNHNPPGVHLTLEASVEPDLIRCSVSDNGVGMNQETTAMVFQLYTQGNTPKQRPKRGLGLGLYLCHQIITAHGGDIGVDSCPNIGTTFWFTLPRQSNA
jgi:PAS domain S-box-containing protein